MCQALHAGHGGLDNLWQPLSSHCEVRRLQAEGLLAHGPSARKPGLAPQATPGPRTCWLLQPGRAGLTRSCTWAASPHSALPSQPPAGLAAPPAPGADPTAGPALASSSTPPPEARPAWPSDPCMGGVLSPSEGWASGQGEVGKRKGYDRDMQGLCKPQGAAAGRLGGWGLSDGRQKMFPGGNEQQLVR